MFDGEVYSSMADGYWVGDGAYVDHLASEHSAYTGYTPLYLAVESGADGK